MRWLRVRVLSPSRECSTRNVGSLNGPLLVTVCPRPGPSLRTPSVRSPNIKSPNIKSHGESMMDRATKYGGSALLAAVVAWSCAVGEGDIERVDLLRAGLRWATVWTVESPALGRERNAAGDPGVQLR